MTTAAAAPRVQLRFGGLLVATLSGAACSLALDFGEDIRTLPKEVLERE